MLDYMVNYWKTASMVGFVYVSPDAIMLLPVFLSWSKWTLPWEVVAIIDSIIHTPEPLAH